MNGWQTNSTGIKTVLDATWLFEDKYPKPTHILNLIWVLILWFLSNKDDEWTYIFNLFT